MGIYKRGDHDAPELCLEGSPQNSLSICRIHNVYAGAKCKKSLGTYYHYTRNWCTKTNRAARLRTCHVLGSSRRTPKSSRRTSQSSRVISESLEIVSDHLGEPRNHLGSSRRASKSSRIISHTGTPWRAQRKCWINIMMTPLLEYT